MLDSPFGGRVKVSSDGRGPGRAQRATPSGAVSFPAPCETFGFSTFVQMRMCVGFPNPAKTKRLCGM